MTTNPYTHNPTPLPAQPLLLPARVSMNYPQPSKLYPQPFTPESRVKVNHHGGFKCDVSLVNERSYYLTIGDVYLPESDELIVSLKAAMGQSRRNPQVFSAVVMPTDPRKARSFRTVKIQKGEDLLVCL